MLYNIIIDIILLVRWLGKKNSFRFIFQLVDMHQGPIDVATNDHELGVLRLSEIEDAHRISEGPFFVVSVNNGKHRYLLWCCAAMRRLLDRENTLQTLAIVFFFCGLK